MSNLNKGQSLIEFIIAIGLAAIFLPALLTGLISSREGKAQQNQRLKAVALLKETEEVVRDVREKGWTTFAVNGTFHPEISGNSWNLASGTETVGGFTRQVVISDVYRNESGVIVSSGGTVDPSTKKATITVSWGLPFFSSIDSTSYLTRYLNNTSFIQTTEEDFNSGTTEETVVINDSGGEVVLGAGGQGSWCNPDLLITALDLPKQGVANAISAVEGHASVGTGENASGVSYAHVTISNDNPPIAFLDGTFDGYKTNDIFGDANYAYVATDTSAEEIVILDISALPYTEVGFFNSPGPIDANSVFMKGSTGYMTAGDKLYNFDLTEKTGSRPAIDEDGLILAGTGEKVVVVGNYAYVAISGSSIHLQIIDVSNPTDLTIVGQASADGVDGQDIFVNQTGTRAYLVTSEQETKREFFIIDVTVKTGDHTSIGSFETNGMNPKGVTVVPGNRAIIVGRDGEEYQVINISDETNPTYCGGLRIDAGINGISSVLEADGDAFSYIITGDANSEFKIIEGGPGGQYTGLGTFESDTFDPGYQVAYNRFDTIVSQPAQTEIKFQIAVADAVAGSCDSVSFTFVGPDGTSETFFPSGDSIPLDDDGIDFENPGRCFRYKVYLSTEEATMTPTFYDIVLNYSP